MNQYCVVVANGNSARFFTLESADMPEMESGPNLVIQKNLSSLDIEDVANGVWTENKSGGNRGHGGQSHGYDDHRAQHDDEIERRFANSIADECKRLSPNKSANFVLVSQKRMLGFLRDAMESRLGTVAKQELAKDMSKLKPMEIHHNLAREKLIPERRTPQE